MGLKKFRKKEAKDERYYNLSVIMANTEKYLNEHPMFTTRNWNKDREVVWNKKCLNGK